MTDSTPGAAAAHHPPEGEHTTALVERSRGRSPIWLVPLIALAVVAMFVAQQWWNRGPRIEVEIPRATGIEAGRTRVLSRGVPIGTVERVRLDEALERPIVEIQLERWASAFARAGSVFWVVTPSIGFHGVSGLETLASGPVIEARAGGAADSGASRFVALDRAPSDASGVPGLRLRLLSPRLGSIRVGSPVTYRDIEVGEVIATELSADGRMTEIAVVIGESFAPLVRTNTQFWGRGGLGLDLGMTGLKLRTESIESIIGGGIAFATPDGEASPAPSDATFELLDEEPKNWLKWLPGPFGSTNPS
jgi:paraquat-inducible protein B